jgi:hypothetical protein
MNTKIHEVINAHPEHEILESKQNESSQLKTSNHFSSKTELMDR